MGGAIFSNSRMIEPELFVRWFAKICGLFFQFRIFYFSHSHYYDFFSPPQEFYPPIGIIDKDHIVDIIRGI